MTLDESLVHALRSDYSHAPISRSDQVMLDYVIQLTKDATRITAEDHARLDGAGFDEKAILQIMLIASLFNYINRVADAPGAGRVLHPGVGSRPESQVTVSTRRRNRLAQCTQLTFMWMGIRRRL